MLASFDQEFDRFIQRYIHNSNEDNQGLLTYYEKEWLSPCYSENIDRNELVAWKPALRNDSANLNNLEAALEITIPLSLQQLFCRYYSHDLNAQTEKGALTILQAWNEDDFDRLQKNLIAHVLMKRRLKQRDTLFFALTDEEDFILSLDLETEKVMLEQVGKEATQEIAPNLHVFMSLLVPAPCLVTL